MEAVARYDPNVSSHSLSLTHGKTARNVVNGVIMMLALFNLLKNVNIQQITGFAWCKFSGFYHQQHADCFSAAFRLFTPRLFQFCKESMMLLFAYNLSVHRNMKDNVSPAATFYGL